MSAERDGVFLPVVAWQPTNRETDRGPWSPNDATAFKPEYLSSTATLESVVEERLNDAMADGALPPMDVLVLLDTPVPPLRGANIEAIGFVTRPPTGVSSAVAMAGSVAAINAEGAWQPPRDGMRETVGLSPRALATALASQTYGAQPGSPARPMRADGVTLLQPWGPGPTPLVYDDTLPVGTIVGRNESGQIVPIAPPRPPGPLPTLTLTVMDVAGLEWAREDGLGLTDDALVVEARLRQLASIWIGSATTGPRYRVHVRNLAGATALGYARSQSPTDYARAFDLVLEESIRQNLGIDENDPSFTFRVSVEVVGVAYRVFAYSREGDPKGHGVLIGEESVGTAQEAQMMVDALSRGVRP